MTALVKPTYWAICEQSNCNYHRLFFAKMHDLFRFAISQHSVCSAISCL